MSSKQSRAHHALVVQRAIGLRAAPTASEHALWLHLRGRQLGVWFKLPQLASRRRGSSCIMRWTMARRRSAVFPKAVLARA